MSSTKRIDVSNYEHSKHVSGINRRVDHTSKQSGGRGNRFPIGPSRIGIIILLVLDLKQEFHGVADTTFVYLLTLPYGENIVLMREEIIEVDGRCTIMVLNEDRRVVPDGLIRSAIYTEIE